MILVLSDIAVVIVLGGLVILRGQDRYVKKHKIARWLLAAGLVPLVIMGAVFLVIGVLQITSGDWGGSAHLLSFFAIFLLGLLSWRRPLEGGVMLLILVVLNLIYYPDLPALLLPHLLAGLLLIAGALVARRSALAPRSA